MSTYVVNSNMPGYMPDSEGAEFDNLEQAWNCLIEDIENYIDSLATDTELQVERLQEFETTLKQVKDSEPQQCNVYLGDYVFYIAEI